MPLTFPCTICAKSCKRNQNSIYCDICQKWTHQKCSEVSVKDFITLGKSNLPYFCVKCYETIFPFHNLTNAAFSELNSTEEKNIQPNFQMLDDIDYVGDFPNSYITPEKFHKEHGTTYDFFMLHVNIRSLNKNLEKLEEFLTQLGKLPEIIAISETKLQTEFEMQLQGYSFIKTIQNQMQVV